MQVDCALGVRWEVVAAYFAMDGLHDDAAEPNIHNEGHHSGDANEIWNDDALLQAYENAVSGFKSRTDSFDRPSRAHRCASFVPRCGSLHPARTVLR